MADLELKSSPRRSNANSKGAKIAAIVLGALLLIVLLVGAWYLWNKKARYDNAVSELQNRVDALSNTTSNTSNNVIANNAVVSNNTVSNTVVSNNTSVSNNTVTPPTSTTPALMDGYQLFTNDTYGYTLQFPKSWYWHKLSAEFLSIGVKEADLAIPNSGYGGKMGIQVAEFTTTGLPAGTKIEDVTINGAAVKKYTIPAFDTEMGPQPKMIQYVFPLSGAKKLIATDEADYQSSVFNKVVNSIVIK